MPKQPIRATPVKPSHVAVPETPPPPPPRHPARVPGEPSSVLLEQSLNPLERAYFRSNLRKRERQALTDLLQRYRESKRVRNGRGSEAEGVLTVPLRIEVLQSCLPESVKLRIFQELGDGAGNCTKYVQWVKRVLHLPFGRTFVSSKPMGTSMRECLERASTAMEEKVTGQEVLKREVLKLVCQEQCGATGAGAYALGLEGPPGTGKTHFVRHALAPALGRPMVCIPLGGATDVSYLLGSVYTYEGSKEGRLAAALIEAKCCNPILYFDEVDKVSQSSRGQEEIIGALIHLIDPSANTCLRDRYFHDIDLDFSKCTFVFSYNDPSKVSPILLDRIKRMAVPVPSMQERIRILQNHLVPRTMTRLSTPLRLSEEALQVLLTATDLHGGMRGAEKLLDHVLSNAQLETCLAGKSSTVQDSGGHVGASFTRKALESYHSVGIDAHLETPPPVGMYT